MYRLPLFHNSFNSFFLQLAMPRGSDTQRATTTNTTKKSSGKNSKSGGTSNSSGGGARSNNSSYAPYGGWHGFMHSYGLKPWDDDDVAEGRAILEALKAHDLEEE